MANPRDDKGIKKIQIGRLRFRKVRGKWYWLYNGKWIKYGTDPSGR